MFIDIPDDRPPLVHDPLANHEYIVTVYDKQDWPSLWEELTVDGLGDNHIPQRGIEVMNGRPYNERSAHFSLTDAEAAEIRLDPRIEAVEIKYDLQREKRVIPFAVRSGKYDSSSTLSSDMLNWGLVACTNTERIFSLNNFVAYTDYHYVLDGDGVDIVMLDTGIAPDHPEFAVNADGTGGTRVVDFDWASLGVPGTKTATEMGGYLGDVNGHGSYCASLVAGNTQGWAPKAAIYSIRASGSFPLIPQNIDIVFDLVTAFHLAKIAAGNPRPTICSNSWGFGGYYWDLFQTRYRGVLYNNIDGNFNREWGQNPPTGMEAWPARDAAIDSAVEAAINAGVILVAAAGNFNHAAQLPSEDITNDYNNYFSRIYDTSQENYYMRGSSPGAAPGMISVGASYTYQIVIGDEDNPIVQDIDSKAFYSCCGPRIDVWAPGTYTSGASVSAWNPKVPDLRNPFYSLVKGQGTSMACPQVAGVLALAAQLNPTMNQADALAFITTHAINGRMDDGASPDPSWPTPNNYWVYNMYGSPNRFLYFPYSQTLPEGPIMLDFPTSPTLNQEYSVAGKTWRWNGTAWKLVWVPPVTSVNGLTGDVVIPSPTALSIIFGS